MRILVTGGAGFIGAHCVHRLVREGHQLCVVDNFNDYYSPQLKEDRITWLRREVDSFDLHRLDIADSSGLLELFEQFRPEVVLHLAAQAGVRYSIERPDVYLQSNLVGFLNLLEACRAFMPQHLIYASSSSVYGANEHIPYSEKDNVDHPLSLYAATKKANEGLAHAYAHLYDIPCTGLRFFTVYGPWGRPDMSPMLFAHAISEGRPVKLFNYGRHRRDFTYIDDVVESITRLLDKAPARSLTWDGSASTSYAPWRICNIGGQRPVQLIDYIAILERLLGREAVLEFLPLQPGDVLETCADTRALEQLTGFAPRVDLEQGLALFVKWFRTYTC